MTTVPHFTIQNLLEAGVHFGHRTMRWNPKMAPYIYGIKDDTHIINLQYTAPLLHNALKAVFEVAKRNGKVLFVGTKTQASEIVKQAASRCGQYYVNHRWLGGMLTNWSTVSQSIQRLEHLEETIAAAESGQAVNYTKKEVLDMNRKREKLELSLGGIREMNGVPSIVVVIDTNKESIAIDEAKNLHIPVIGILDTNSNPDRIDYPIPGNDDATRAIELYCKLFSDAVLSGIQASMIAAGIEIKDLTNLDAVIEIADRQRQEKRSKKSQLVKMEASKKVNTKLDQALAASKVEAEDVSELMNDENTSMKSDTKEEAKPKKKAASKKAKPEMKEEAEAEKESGEVKKPKKGASSGAKAEAKPAKPKKAADKKTSGSK